MEVRLSLNTVWCHISVFRVVWVGLLRIKIILNEVKQNRNIIDEVVVIDG